MATNGREVRCDECIWFETFVKRDDEPSDKGRRENNWAGYVGNVTDPPCGGIAFSRRKDE